jgi:outer membrane protein assembly factor BamB
MLVPAAVAVLALHAVGDIPAARPPVPRAEAEWPQFRGPDGQGRSDAKGLPLTWGETENVAWKAAVPGLGWSSPVIGNGKIWLTTALDGGRSLRALCLDLATGKLVRDVEVFADNQPRNVHSLNSHASPTPILDGDRVYVHFGAYGTACLDTDGKIIWKTKLEHATYYGPSSSPVLYGDLLIVPCQGTDVRYTAALDKHTGKVRWKRNHDGRNSESTPLVVRAPAGDQVVCNFADRVVAYDPLTGREVWSAKQGNNFAQVPRPVCGHGLVITCGGYFEPVVQAIRPDGQGDVSKTHVAWSLRQAVPQNPSPLLVGDELYLVTDKGQASCLDARTGKLLWRERVGNSFYASPTFGDGRVYFLADDGVTTVVAAGPRFQKLAVNKLPGRAMASLAVAGKAIYLRTDKHLYRIEKK